MKSFFCLCVVGMCAISLHAAILTVAPIGADYTSVQAAAAAAKGGDTIIVWKGVYSETVQLSKSIPKTAPVVLTPRKGDTVTVTGGFTITGDYYLVDGFLITRGMIQFSSGAEYNVALNCRIENVAGSAVKFISGSSHNTVRHCSIYKPGNKGLELSGSYNTFEYSTIEGPTGQAGNQDSDGIRNYGGDHNVIRGNHIFHLYNVGASHGDGFQLWQYFRHLTFEDNVVGSRDDPAQDDPGNAHMMIELVDSSSDTLIIRRNLFLGADQAIDVYQNQETRPARFKNVFVYNNLFATDQVTEFIAMQGLSIKNNVFSANLNRPYSISAGCEQVEADYNCIFPGGSLIVEPHGVKKDPLFIGAPSNYHLKAGSPCVDAGLAVGLTHDKDGKSIIGNQDIGPFEYQPMTDGKSLFTWLPKTDEDIAALPWHGFDVMGRRMRPGIHGGSRLVILRHGVLMETAPLIGEGASRRGEFGRRNGNP